MVGKKGQKNPSKHRRKNEYTIGLKEPTRHPEVFPFKLPIELYPRVKAEIEENGLTKQAFCDRLLAHYYGNGEESLEKSELNDEVRDAVLTVLELKRAALSRERKAKRPNQEYIERLETAIAALENAL